MSKKILVVEDDIDIAWNLKELLESEGYEVETAKNGKVALAHLRSTQKPPNLIILDIMMPVMDGFVFRKNQKRDPALSKIPVVVMTADGHIEEKRKRAEAVASIRKPPELETILRVIDRHIL